MTLIIHILAGLMYVVLLAPLWLYLGLQLRIRLARRQDRLDGWLAQADRILNEDRGTPRKVRDRPEAEPQRNPHALS